MYRCQRCGECVARGTPRQVISSYRQAQHPVRKAAFKVTVIERGKRVTRWKDDPGGVGKQVAVEVAVCAACHRAHEENGDSSSEGVERL